MIKVNIERFLSGLNELQCIGAPVSDKVVVRTAFSETDFKAREWLCTKFSEIDLFPYVDPVGNTFGLAKEQSVIIGSHTDTQPEGGWLDGALGEICSLELARAAVEAGQPQISIVSFQDEEGRYGVTTGRAIWSGTLSLELADLLSDSEGITFLEARRLMPNRSEAFLDPTLFNGFIECHIEKVLIYMRPDIKSGLSLISLIYAIVRLYSPVNRTMPEQYQCIVVRMHFRRLLPSPIK